MANIVTDPSFELDLGWTYTPIGTRSTINPHTGSYSVRLSYPAQSILPAFVHQEDLLLSPGEVYDVSMWIDGTTAFGQPLECWIDAGDGNLVLLGTSNSQDTWSEWLVGSFLAIGATGVVKIANATTIHGRIWWVDDVSIVSQGAVDMAAKVKAIKAAILSTLTGVSGVAATSISGEPISPDTVALPALIVTVLDEVKEYDALQRRRGKRRFLIECWAGTAATAEGDADDLAAAVETILETQTGGTFLGLGYVYDVTVDSSEPFEAASDVAKGMRVVFLEVSVTYTYTRGNP